MNMAILLKNGNARSYETPPNDGLIPHPNVGTGGNPQNLYGNVLEVNLPTDKNIRHLILDFSLPTGDPTMSAIIVNLEINGEETILEGYADRLQKNNIYLFGVNQTTFSDMLFIPLENDPITHEGIIRANILSSFKLILRNEHTANQTLTGIGYIELKDLEE